MHELLKFLTDKKVFNQYAKYSLSDLLAGDRVTRTIYATIQELHEGNPGESGELSLDELKLVVQDRLRPEQHADLGVLLRRMSEVDSTKFSSAAVAAAFRAAYKRSVAAYLATAVLPVLNGGEDLDISSILKKLEETSNQLNTTDNLVQYGEYVENGQVDRPTIPSYIPLLDDVIDGGLSPGQLATYVGWPGIGKTLLLHQSAAMAYYHGHHAGLVTLEINKNETCRRIDLLFGREANKDLFAKIAATANERGGKLTILDGADDVFSPASVRSFLESQRRRGHPIDVLFIDYADLMETGRKLEDYNELGEIYRDLRRISARFGVPIWTASQAVRGSLNKRWLGMDDIADSFKKARIADLIVTINQTYEEREAGKMRLAIVKSRRNPGSPKIHLDMDLTRMRVVAPQAI